MTTTRTLPVLLALLLAGCGAPFNNRWFEEDALFTSAVPEAGELRSDSPDADAQSRDVGDPSRAVAFTQETASTVNGRNLALLSVLDTVVQEPITGRDEHTRRWGPLDFPRFPGRSVQLHVERLDEGAFAYTLEGRAAAADEDDGGWVLLLDGEFDRIGDLRDGEGAFTYDAGAVASLIGDGGGGTMTSEYATDAGFVQLQSEFRDWVDPDRDARDWDYYFERHRGGGGVFEFRTPAQVVGDPDSPLETWRLRTRWAADLRGRADAFVRGGDVTGRIPSVECWDEDTRRTYYRVGSPDAPLEEEGLARDCALEEDAPRDLRE